MELKEYSQATRLLIKYRKTLDVDELDLKASINQVLGAMEEDLRENFGLEVRHNRKDN